MKDLTKIRIAILVFVALLILSGITAFPLRTEMDFLMAHKNSFPVVLSGWIETVYNAVKATPDVILYGTDWLAFAHIIIALFFVPVYLDPIRYKANLLVAITACGLVFLLAFVCGPIRGIPFFHQLIDCSFGFIGFFPLYFIYRKINQLKNKKMNAPVKHPRKPINLLSQIHEKIASWSAHLLGPIVFNFGTKERAWNISTANLLGFPNDTVGKTLGEFLKANRLEPIAGAESHDLYHVLFNYSSSFKDEVALQFFLRGNGKNSIASFGTFLGAWIVLPGQWSYLKASYKRGKKCMDISRLDMKSILFKNFDEVKATLFEESKTN